MKLVKPLFGVLESISKAEMLESINLCNNLIKDPKEVELLADIIKVQRLTHLNVERCFSTADDMATIIAAVHKSKTLQAVHVGNNPTVASINEGTTVLSRYLGHREIEGSHKFRQSNRCWICERWRPVVVLAISKHRPTITGEGMSNQPMMTVKEFMSKVDANMRPWLRTYEGVDKGKEPPAFTVKFPQLLN